MLFNSLPFLFFLPLVFLLYWFAFKPLRLRNAFLVVASYVFYGWWDCRFVLLLLFTSLCSYAGGLLLEKWGADDSLRKRCRAVVALNVAVNLLILFVFKYFNFFSESLTAVLHQFGLRADLPTLHLLLPVGISFYTFQALGYIVDVYRRQIPATHDVWAFLAFLSFFPQLVAGPIERASNLLPQMMRQRCFDYDAAVDGMRQMLWGFFKKMLVADNCALFVDAVWAAPETHSPAVCLLAALLFTVQIYSDFSGYSDIAIGCARLFGIRLSRNFDNPYFSRSVKEFWRRWHMTLMAWFRDYIYIPLGGSRRGLALTVRNIAIVFLLSGLWHGARWTYVAWGGYHAVLLIVLTLWSRFAGNRPASSPVPSTPHLKGMIQVFITFALVCIGWILFRSESMGQAVGMAEKIFRFGSYKFLPDEWGLLNYYHLPRLFFYVIVLFGAEWLSRRREHALCLTSGAFRFRAVRWSVYVVLAVVIVAYHVTDSPFIYFQF